MPHLQANGINIYYELHGTGQPLLFIHGLGSSTRDWELQVAQFAKTHQVITFDLRGHGQSDKPDGPYSMAMFAADAAGLLQALDVATAHIVGLSLGGGVAFQLTADFPTLVKTMTIVNSAPELVIRTFKERMSVWQRFIIVRLLGMRKMGEVLAPRLFPEETQAPLRTTFVERWAENDPRAYREAMRALVGWSVSDRLGAMHCPALIITADQDYTPVALKEAYAQQLPNAQLVVIANAHHATPMERPEQFNTVLMTFLNAHS